MRTDVNRREFSAAKLAGLIATAFLLAPATVQAQSGPAGRFQSQMDSRDLHRELDSRRDRDLQRFYHARDWRPLWVSGWQLSPAADSLVALVARADADGLNRRALRYDDLLATLRRADRDPNSRNLARAEAALSRTLSAYVRGTRMQRETEMAYQTSLLAPVVPTATAALESAAAAPSLTRYLDGLEWMHPLYGELRRALVTQQFDREQERLVWLNLERARALPADPAPRYVLIDAAGARLWMYENGKPVDSMKVVVGRADQPTPMMAGLLTEAVLNPYWNVPVDLAQSRIANNVIDGGLGYLKSGGYQVLSDFTDDAKVIDPSKVDWRAVARGEREVRVRQLPGKTNFMGKVKFNFPNAEGIYLHDTPDKALLKAEVRTASSGCVRLEDASRLGKWLYGKPLVPNVKKIEQSVPLDKPVPVYITYMTAAPVEGRIVFRDDVYQRDGAQWAALTSVP